jgi:C-terminal processing protease CtpA/Prc
LNGSIMKKLFATPGLLVVTTVAIITLMTPAVFGQEKVTPNVEGARLPEYIPPGCAGKTITKMSRAEMLAMTVPDVKLNPPITQSNQLRLFNELAKIIDEVYLYPDFKGLNWPDTVAKFRSKVEAGLETEEFYAEMEQFIRNLGDRHSSFESPVRAAAVTTQLAGKNNFVGVGAVFQSLEETKHVTILAVIPGSPADHSGLQQHDIVLL